MNTKLLFSVTADHPILASPDKDFTDRRLAMLYVRALEIAGYENIVIHQRGLK